LQPWALILAATLLSMLFTWPAVALGGRGVPGWNWSDEAMFLWSYWLAGRWLWEGTDILVYKGVTPPYGVLYFVNTHSFLYGILAALVRPLTGSLAASFNAVVIWAFAVSMATMYLLARSLRLGMVGAFTAAIVFAFNTHRLGHAAGHPNLMATETLPLAAWGVLLLVRSIRRNRVGLGKRRVGFVRAWLGLGVLALASLYTLYTDYYIVLYYALVAFFVAAVLAWVARTRLSGALASQGLYVAFAFWVSVGAVALWPVLWSWHHAYTTWGAPPGSGGLYEKVPGTDLATCLLPRHGTPVAWLIEGSGLVKDYREWRPSPIEGEGYLGLTVLALAFVALRRRGSKARLLLGRICLAGALLFFVFSMGDQVRWWNEDMGIPWLYALINRFQFSENWRAPGRLMMVVGLPIGLLAGLGLERLLRDRRRRGEASWRRVALVVVLFAAFVAEMWRPLHVSWIDGPTPIPLRSLQRIKESPHREGTVFIFPLDHHAALSNLFQIFHERTAYFAFMARMDMDIAGQLMRRNLGYYRPDETPMFPWDAMSRAGNTQQHALLRRTVETFDIRWFLIAGGPEQEAQAAYLRAALPMAWEAKETTPNGDHWLVMEVDRQDDPERLIIYDGTLDNTPADLLGAINEGWSAGHITKRQAKFVVHLSGERGENFAERGALVAIGATGLPPLPDGRLQFMEVTWDGPEQVVGRFLVQPELSHYTLEIPREWLTPGWHILGLESLREVTPRLTIPGSEDDRVLAMLPYYILLQAATPPPPGDLP